MYCVLTSCVKTCKLPDSMRSSISASVVVLPAAIETWSYNSYRVKPYDRAMSVTAG